MNFIWHTLIGFIVAGTPLVLIEFLARKFTLPAELTRKSTHLLSALSVVVLTIFCNLEQIAVIAILFIVLLSITRPRHIWQSLYRINRKSLGEITFPAGVLIAALFAPDTASFVLIILIVGLSDTLASFAGQHIKSTLIVFTQGKSIAGSLACFFSSLLITSLMCRQLNAQVVGFSLIVTVAEAASSKGLDNLTVPLAGVLYLSFISLGGLS